MTEILIASATKYIYKKQHVNLKLHKDETKHSQGAQLNFYNN